MQLVMFVADVIKRLHFHFFVFSQRRKQSHIVVYVIKSGVMILPFPRVIIRLKVLDKLPAGDQFQGS